MLKKDNTVTIGALNANQRLDKFLFKYFNKAEKSLVYKLLRKKRIKLNSGKAEGNELLNDGDVITFYLAPETIESLYDGAASPASSRNHAKKRGGVPPVVIYEDANLLIANKPAGLLTHSETVNDTDTFIDRVIAYLRDKGEYTPAQGVFAPVCCNRLDRNTSGIIACAKNLPMAQKLNEAFKQRETVKIYTAVVCGRLSNDAGSKMPPLRIDMPIEGKDALTEVMPMFCGERNGAKFTVVKVRLHTGRQHQIRLHMKHIGHPIIGDPKYGDPKLNKTFGMRFQLLHASELTVLGMKFDCELPKEFGMFV